MRLFVFSKFWLLQFQKSINLDVKTINAVFQKRKYLVSAQTYTWASGTLLGLVALFFSIKNVLLYFDFNFKFNSNMFLFAAPIIFLDSNLYFSSKMASWGFEKNDIFLRAGVGVSYIKYNFIGSSIRFFFKSCTCYRFVDLFSAATLNNLPAFDVFWNCFISVNNFQHSIRLRSLLLLLNKNIIMLRQSVFFLLYSYLF